MSAPEPFALSMAELRETARYAAACARPVLAVFERDRPSDLRPRAALDAAEAFAAGAPRSKALRDAAWAAQGAAIAARDDGLSAASEAARAAMAAAAAGFLHPLPQAAQVKHVLGAAAHAARALEQEAADDPAVASAALDRARRAAAPSVIAVLRRYPPAPPGGGRTGALIRELDALLRSAPEPG
ncbi:putative immunity protein [Brevundimonas faecalis]|uniref:Imm-5-like domain-containing protein n=1 Tax=Brevundimonas faecalis TaxID=947378 RepID=A0ABV2R8C4_9CAUL